MQEKKSLWDTSCICYVLYCAKRQAQVSKCSLFQCSRQYSPTCITCTVQLRSGCVSKRTSLAEHPEYNNYKHFVFSLVCVPLMQANHLITKKKPQILYENYWDRGKLAEVMLIHVSKHHLLLPWYFFLKISSEIYLHGSVSFIYTLSSKHLLPLWSSAMLSPGRSALCF